MPDIKNSYETVFILSTSLGDDGITATIDKFKSLIEAHGTIDSVDDWGKRRLAYPINKQNEGHYTLISFTSSPEFTAELDRIYKITDGVIRSLIVRKEAKKERPQKAAEAKKAVEVKKSENAERE
ncbi:MAG TPA: 30S ribosomal protein S6 [Ruminococcaceae bacterium]|mgnify:FL=1|jgi:small subunit ribosomal protein S6|nr:30S ribosomal protein S6 [Oscillospiraceae bacterium]